MRKTKTFVSKGYSETSVPTIVYKDDCEPCAVYVNGERQDNISYIPKVNEGVSSVQYKSEYKNNLRSLQVDGNTEQDTYGGYNLFNIDAVTGASYRVDSDNVGISDEFGTITNGVMHLKYGLVWRAVVWNGSPIPIRQGGDYRISCDVLVEESAASSIVYCTLANMTKNTFIQPYTKSTEIVKGVWTRYEFPVQTVPYDWIGDTVLLCFSSVGTAKQGTNIPIYAKNVMVTYENNLYDISKVNGAAPANTTTPDVAGEARFGTVTNEVLNLAYGVYDKGIIWTGSKIPIKQAGKYSILFDFMCENSMNGSYTYIYISFRNLTKGTSVAFATIADDNVRDVWQVKTPQKSIEIPDTWVGDDVYLQLQVAGNSNQYSKMPVYAKNIMISYGEAKPYQPYGGNVPYEPYYGGTGYPSIKYPQVITNCGNNNIEVVARGVNLFDIDNPLFVAETANILKHHSPKIENGVIYSGGKLASTEGAYICIETDEESMYIISFNADFDETTQTSRNYRLVYFNDFTDGVFSSQKYSTYGAINKGKQSIRISSYGYKYIGFASFSNALYGMSFTDFQIEKGGVTTPYEPYFNSTVSIPANVVLESGANETLLELAKIGDIADTITIDRVNNEVKYTQRICRVRPFVNVGGTLWYDSYTSQYYNVDLWEFDLDKYTNTGVMKCEFAKVAPITEAETEFCVEIGNTYMMIGIPKSLSINTPEALASYLMQTGTFGLSIEYVLEKPIEWTITDNMERMGSTVKLKTNLLEWARNTKNQTNIIEITSTPSVSKTSVNYAKWGGSNEV